MCVCVCVCVCVDWCSVELHPLPSLSSLPFSPLSAQVFHDVAYKARNRDDLLAGVDEFLDKVTVLPPGEWDPQIRLEPPPRVYTSPTVHKNGWLEKSM